MIIQSISEDNSNLVEEFVNQINQSPVSHFRYFQKRTLSCLKNHFVTLVATINNRSIGYGHLDRDDKGSKVWL